MRIYEFFRKTKETYIFIQLNIDGFSLYNINLNLYFLKHMLEQIVINGLFNLNILSINDLFIDNHHFIEDLGIVLGKIFNISNNNNFVINRYGFYYITLDDCISRVIIDLSNRSYLKYNILYNNYYINNINIDLFYDFFISFVNNFNISIHIINIYGNNIHHKIETIFKALGRSLKLSLKINYFNNKLISSKGIL